MSKERLVCSHCGAVQKEGSTVCDLCGSSLEGNDLEEIVEEVAAVSAADAEGPVRSKSAPTTSRGGFCTGCGAPFPVGARFCGSCGEKIVSVESAADEATRDLDDQTEEASGAAPVGSVPLSVEAAPKRAATDMELGRQVLIVVGAAVILIIALFVITAVSRNGDSSPPGSSDAIGALVSAPLPPEVQATVESLRSDIDASTGEERISKQRELADFLISHGRWDLAAAAQAEIAETTGAEADWVRSGNLYYDWMDGVEGDSKAAFAKKAIESYQNALQINPNNLDVRTDMAIAFMFDPENSVQAIAQTNMVLEEDSMHVQANFNRGIMLLRVNRFDEAAFQFNKVMRIVADPENPIYQRAESALEAIRQAGI